MLKLKQRLRWEGQHLRRRSARSLLVGEQSARSSLVGERPDTFPVPAARNSDVVQSGIAKAGAALASGGAPQGPPFSQMLPDTVGFILLV